MIRSVNLPSKYSRKLLSLLVLPEKRRKRPKKKRVRQKLKM